MKWYTKSSEQDYAPAQNDLGVMFLRTYWKNKTLLLGEEAGRLKASAKYGSSCFEIAFRWYAGSTKAR